MFWSRWNPFFLIDTVVFSKRTKTRDIHSIHFEFFYIQSCVPPPSPSSVFAYLSFCDGFLCSIYILMNISFCLIQAFGFTRVCFSNKFNQRKNNGHAYLICICYSRQTRTVERHCDRIKHQGPRRLDESFPLILYAHFVTHWVNFFFSKG